MKNVLRKVRRLLKNNEGTKKVQEKLNQYQRLVKDGLEYLEKQGSTFLHKESSKEEDWFDVKKLQQEELEKIRASIKETFSTKLEQLNAHLPDQLERYLADIDVRIKEAIQAKKESVELQKDNYMLSIDALKRFLEASQNIVPSFSLLGEAEGEIEKNEQELDKLQAGLLEEFKGLFQVEGLVGRLREHTERTKREIEASQRAALEIF